LRRPRSAAEYSDALAEALEIIQRSGRSIALDEEVRQGARFVMKMPIIR
jgi:hypothetical protein